MTEMVQWTKCLSKNDRNVSVKKKQLHSEVRWLSRRKVLTRL